MKSTITRCLAIAAFSIVLYTGASAQSTSYKVVENDPDRYNFLVNVNPFHIVAYLPAITIGYNLEAKYMANDRLQLEAGFYKAYLDGNATSVFSPGGLTKAYSWQLGGELVLSSRTYTGSNKVVLDFTSFGRSSTTTFMIIPAEKKRIFGIRGGIQHFYDNLKVGNDISAAAGANDIHYRNKQGSLQALRDSNTFETINYSASTYAVYAGIDLKTIRDVIIDADGYGQKSSQGMNNFYFDIFYAPLVNYELFTNNNQAYLSGIDINTSDNTRRHLGWRFGWQYYYYGDFAGFNAKMELGQQPGAGTDNPFFLSFGFGLTISKNLKVPFLQNLGVQKAAVK